MPFRYLSILLSSKKLRNPLLDFLVRRINSWLWKTLSYARKT